MLSPRLESVRPIVPASSLECIRPVWALNTCVARLKYPSISNHSQPFCVQPATIAPTIRKRITSLQLRKMPGMNLRGKRTGRTALTINAPFSPFSTLSVAMNQGSQIRVNTNLSQNLCRLNNDRMQTVFPPSHRTIPKLRRHLRTGNEITS